LSQGQSRRKMKEEREYKRRGIIRWEVFWISNSQNFECRRG
jgi:hypothetical protein